MNMTPKWPRRMLVATLALGGAAAVYQRTAEARDERCNPPPGDLFDVGGYRLHAVIAGEGATTVVFLSGLGGTCLAWYGIQREIARETRTISYDRGGLGWSDHRPGRSTSRVIAEELRALLYAAGIAPPYVLVGHSFGGVHARAFADQYPDEVAGMVLVDSSHEGQPPFWERRPRLTKIRETVSSWIYLLNPLLARSGILRLRGMSVNLFQYLPVEVRRDARALALRSRAFDGGVAEYRAITESYGQVRAARTLGDMPLIVLTVLSRSPQRGFVSEGQFNAFWMELQSQLAALSSNSIHVVANTDEHFMQHGEPELVVDAIRQVLTLA